MEEKTVTALEVLREVNGILNNISIPMSHLNDIGMPVAQAITGIQMCIDAMAKSEEAKKQAESAGKEDA